MQYTPSLHVADSAARSRAVLGKRSRGAGTDFNSYCEEEYWSIDQGYIESYDVWWHKEHGYHPGVMCGRNNWPESELRMLRWLGQRNEMCAEVGCNRRATLRCDICSRHFCHVPHAQRRYRVTPVYPNPPWHWTWHCKTYLRDGRTVVECADCASWYTDEAPFPTEHTFPTEIEDVHYALEFDIVPVHWEEAVDGVIRALKVIATQNHTSFLRRRRKFCSILADEGHSFVLWKKRLCDYLRQDSAVPREPERLRWPSNADQSTWREGATPMLRRDCKLAMDAFQVFGRVPDDRARHHRPAERLRRISQEIDFDMMWATSMLESVLPRISLADAAATLRSGSVRIPHPYDTRRRVTVLTDPAGVALLALDSVLSARAAGGDHRTIYGCPDGVDDEVMRAHDADMADWEDSFRYDALFGDPHSWPDGRSAPDSPPPSPTSTAYSPSSPAYSPSSHASSTADPGALEDAMVSSDDGGDVETDMPVLPYPPAVVPHIEDHEQPPDHGSPFPSDSVGDGPADEAMAERVYVQIRDADATRNLESHATKAKVMSLIELSLATPRTLPMLALATKLDRAVGIASAKYAIARNTRAYDDILFVYKAAKRVQTSVAEFPTRQRLEASAPGLSERALFSGCGVNPQFCGDVGRVGHRGNYRQSVSSGGGSSSGTTEGGFFDGCTFGSQFDYHGHGGRNECPPPDCECDCQADAPIHEFVLELEHPEPHRRYTQLPSKRAREIRDASPDPDLGDIADAAGGLLKFAGHAMGQRSGSRTIGGDPVTAVPARPCLPAALSDAAARDLREGADSGNGLEDHLQHQQQQQVDAPRASALTVDHGSLFSSDDEGGAPTAGTAAERVYAAIRDEPSTRRIVSMIGAPKVMHLIDVSFTTLQVSSQLALAVALECAVLIERDGYRIREGSPAFNDTMFVYNAAFDRRGLALAPMPVQPRVSVVELRGGLLKFQVHAVNERIGHPASVPMLSPDFGSGRRQP